MLYRLQPYRLMRLQPREQCHERQPHAETPGDRAGSSGPSGSSRNSSARARAPWRSGMPVGASPGALAAGPSTRSPSGGRPGSRHASGTGRPGTRIPGGSTTGPSARSWPTSRRRARWCPWSSSRGSSCAWRRSSRPGSTGSRTPSRMPRRHSSGRCGGRPFRTRMMTSWSR